MPDFVLALIVKPIFLVMLFGASILIARIILRFIPDGKIKRILMLRTVT